MSKFKMSDIAIEHNEINGNYIIRLRDNKGDLVDKLTVQCGTKKYALQCARDMLKEHNKR